MTLGLPCLTLSIISTDRGSVRQEDPHNGRLLWERDAGLPGSHAGWIQERMVKG